MMAWPTIICGGLLVAVGVTGYVQQDPNPETGAKSPTALIPAFVGGVLVLCGLLAFRDSLRKHVMHLAAVVGLLGLVGGFMPLIRQYRSTGSLDPLKPSALSGEAMILICGVFVGLCIKSFVDARRARAARESAAASGPAA